MPEPTPTILALRPKDAARAIGFSVRALEEWRREGRGPAYLRVGTRIVYPVTALEEWLRQQVRAQEGA